MVVASKALLLVVVLVLVMLVLVLFCCLKDCQYQGEEEAGISVHFG